MANGDLIPQREPKPLTKKQMRFIMHYYDNKLNARKAAELSEIDINTHYMWMVTNPRYKSAILEANEDLVADAMRNVKEALNSHDSRIRYDMTKFVLTRKGVKNDFNSAPETPQLPQQAVNPFSNITINVIKPTEEPRMPVIDITPKETDNQHGKND